MHRKMKTKIGEKMILSLAIAAAVAELINVSKNVFADKPIINMLSAICILVFGGYGWYKLVVEKGVKRYNLKVESTQNRIKTLDFDKIHKKLTAEHRDYLERKRLAIKDRLVIRHVSILVVMVCLFLGVLNLLRGDLNTGMGLMPLGLLGTTIFFATLIKGHDKELEYKAAYKLRIVSNLLKEINPKYKYRLADKEDDQLFREYVPANFGLVEHTHADYVDRIEGEVDGNKLDILEIILEAEVKGNNNTSVNLRVFDGMFAKVQTSKEGNFKLKVSSVGVPTRAEIYEAACEKIKMDNSVFMDNFVVETNEKVLAARILTSDVMTMLLDYKIKYGIDLDMAIKDGIVYFLFYTGDLFEPSVFKDSMNKETLLVDYSTLKMAIELMQKMGTIVTDL